MGFLFHSTKPSDDLLENGRKGTATVVKAKMAVGGVSEYSGSISNRKIEQVLLGEKSSTRYKLELRVELPGHSPYTAKVKLAVPMSKIKFMTGGSVVPVLVDPDKDKRMAIDWSGEFQQGTVGQMAASNPLIAAAMKGAGVDVDAISKMQSDARAAGQTPGNVIIGGQLFGGSAGTSPATANIAQLKQLAELRDSGVLSQGEFETQKARLLGE